MPNPTIASPSRERTMLTIWVNSTPRHVFSIKRFFSVASQASFLPLGPAWLFSVSEPCPYPSCLCLPLCFPFSGCPRSSPTKRAIFNFPKCHPALCCKNPSARLFRSGIAYELDGFSFFFESQVGLTYAVAQKT
jgi:hypothetical protein